LLPSRPEADRGSSHPASRLDRPKLPLVSKSIESQEAIAPAAENVPGVKVDLLPVPFIEMVETSPAAEAEQV